MGQAAGRVGYWAWLAGFGAGVWGVDVGAVSWRVGLQDEIGWLMCERCLWWCWGDEEGGGSIL